MFQLFVVVMVLGKIVGQTGPYENKAVCEQQAAAIYGQIISKAKAQGVTQVKVNGQVAVEKDLVVLCKRFIKPPVVNAVVEQ